MLGRICKLLVLACVVVSLAKAQLGEVGASHSSTARSISFYPYKGRWHGADVAYSIQLSPDRFLWLFGDTFAGKPDTTRISGDSMPRNSIGIATCASGQPCRVEYAWTDHPTGPPTSFFETGTAEFYWPLDGFVANGVLYVVLQKMHTAGDGGAFGFDYSGVVLASIGNFMDPPAVWNVVYQPVLSGNTVIPGVAVVGPEVARSAGDPSAAPDYVYFFTWLKKGGSPEVALMRLSTASLSDPAVSSGHWQYLAKGGEWNPWTTPASLPKDGKALVYGNYTEFTVSYHPDVHRWLMTLPGGIMDGAAFVSYADTLAGNWSTPKAIYTFPESQPSNPDHAPNVFCYAAKEHPELEAPGMFTFTYACNSMKIQEVLANPRLYHPVVVTGPISIIVKPAKK